MKDTRAAEALVRGADSVELDVPVSVAGIFGGSDPLRANQWDLDRIGASAAWGRSSGAGVIVAVLDSGVDASHPDLAGQVLPGVDLVNRTEGTSVDPYGHGTHVAGTIAANAGDGVGITGLAPDVRILPVRVLGDDGNGFMSDVATGIVYAADHGADVINMSISATSPVSAVSEAVAYARSKGVVVVAATGNARAQGSPTTWPASDPGVIGVAATDSADQIAGYSTRGGQVDLSAPGSGIISTYPGGYRWMNGTSMAAPHVAAVAALIRAADRSLSPERIEQILTLTSADLGAPGRDDDFGYGRLDAAAALAAVPQMITKPTTQPTAAQPATGRPTTDQPTPAQTTPAQPTPTPGQTAIQGRGQVRVTLTPGGPGELIVHIDGAEGQTARLQRNPGSGWTTVADFKAAPDMRITGLPAGAKFRLAVAATTSYTGTVSNAVQL